MQNPNLSQDQQRTLDALPARREGAAYHEKKAASLLALLSRLCLAALVVFGLFMTFGPAAERNAPGLGLWRCGEVALSMVTIGLLVLFATYMYHLFKSMGQD
jgi:sterol desaturase/sphingolipid hydroxylase (fatty acid hydroxylase superfamily)